ncbi:Protein ASP-1 protein8 [Aphelenchoides avenae]|nr:Protein ASP-1 protein8 [Aphelenchus avenae]
MGETQSLFASNALDTFNLFLSGITVPDARFALASTTTYPLNPSWSSDGIFPLTFHDDKSNDGILQRILTTVGGKQEVTLSLIKPSRAWDFSGGSISFGDRDYLECKSNWVSFASDKKAWSLPLVNLQIGSKSVYKNRAIAKISLTSTYLGVDYAYLRKIAAAIGAKYDVRLDLYTVDCKKVNKLPNMTLSVGDGFAYTWDVPPQDYVLKKATEKGIVCALLVAVDDAGWSIGSQFLPSACINFDYANNKIGFAYQMDA